MSDRQQQNSNISTIDNTGPKIGRLDNNIDNRPKMTEYMSDRQQQNINISTIDK